MALTPDPTETFAREVDENLRRDQMRDFAKAYGKWLIAGAILFLAAVAGWLYWQERQRQAAAEQSEQLFQSYNDIGANRTVNVDKRLEPLAEADSEAVRAAAAFTGAAVALESGKRPVAIDHYRRVANDDDLPKPYRDLATIRLTALEFDTIQPEEVIARLEPLARTGQPWFGSAGELTAMAYLRQNKRTEAGRLFAAIAADRQVPETIRSRSAQIAGTLGIDASASLPLAMQ